MSNKLYSFKLVNFLMFRKCKENIYCSSCQVTPRDVSKADFVYSLSINGKTVSRDDLEQFTAFTRHFGQSGL